MVQTQGAKRWRVFSPPLTSLAPDSDPFARGKGDDDLPLHLLGKSSSSLLLDVVLQPGDCLFVPARFPHTTGTEEGCEGEKVSAGTACKEEAPDTNTPAHRRPST